MSRKDKIPRFLYDWRAAIIAWSAMAFYCGFFPLLKAIGVLKISWLWALAPVWIPFAAFWYLAGFTAFTVLFTELGLIILPDKEYKGGKQSVQSESIDEK